VKDVPPSHAIEVVPERLDLAPELICSGSRQQRYSEARSLVAGLAVEEWIYENHPDLMEEQEIS